MPTPDTMTPGIGPDEQRRLVAACRERMRAASGGVAPVLIETHISWVLVGARHALKFKKALDLGFADLRRRDDRRRCCDDEVRLNRRLAPAMYVGVDAVTGTVDDPVLQPAGDGSGADAADAAEALDYAVRMRVLDADSGWDRMVADGRLMPAHVDDLAGLIAGFHQALRRDARPSDAGTPQAIVGAARDNLTVLRRLLGTAAARTPLDELAEAERRDGERLAPRMAARNRDGFVRDGHGDLHLANVAMLDGRVTPFDCVDFSTALRTVDVISEIAFMVMDLARVGRADLGNRFLNQYLEHTGDYAGVPLLRYYLAYRALVRAKVAAIRAAQAPPAVPGDRIVEACLPGMRLAAGFGRPHAPALIVTHGLSGSGKSLLARRLSEAIGAIRLRSDVERKRLFGLAPLQRPSDDGRSQLYGAEATVALYERLAALAADVLAGGCDAIVDAACLRRWQRARLRALAASLGVPFVIVSLQAGDAVLQARVAQRLHRNDDASDADLAVLARQQRDREPVTPDEADRHLVVDSDGSLTDAQVARLAAQLSTAGTA